MSCSRATAAAVLALLAAGGCGRPIRTYNYARRIVKANFGTSAIPDAVADAMWSGELVAGMRVDYAKAVTGYLPEFSRGDAKAGSAVFPATCLVISGSTWARYYSRDGQLPEQFWSCELRDDLIVSCHRISAVEAARKWQEFEEWIPPDASDG